MANEACDRCSTVCTNRCTMDDVIELYNTIMQRMSRMGDSDVACAILTAIVMLKSDDELKKMINNISFSLNKDQV